MSAPPPHDAVLLIAFGGPERMEEVRPFLRRVLAGRPISPERFESVVHHYEAIGGRSPLTEITRRQAAALERALAQAGQPLPVAVGMRNSAPFLADALAELHARGARRVLGVIMAAHESPASHGRYREAVQRAVAELGERAPAIDYAGGFHTHPGFVEANAAHLREAIASLPAQATSNARVVFTAHSIPTALAAQSAYAAQIEESAILVARQVGVPHLLIAYQSRSGGPNDAWLEPDVNVVLKQLAAEGASAVVLCPIGFVCDHVEVLYDLDVEAAQTARGLGLPLARARAANDHPAFVDALAGCVLHAQRAYSSTQ